MTDDEIAAGRQKIIDALKAEGVQFCRRCPEPTMLVPGLAIDSGEREGALYDPGPPIASGVVTPVRVLKCPKCGDTPDLPREWDVRK